MDCPDSSCPEMPNDYNLLITASCYLRRVQYKEMRLAYLPNNQFLHVGRPVLDIFLVYINDCNKFRARFTTGHFHNRSIEKA